MFQRGFFLLIARDDGLALTLAEPLQRYSVVRRAKCYRDAAAMLLPNSRWCGVVVDLDGFDAAPPDPMKRVREAHPLVPVLPLPSQPTAELVNGLHACRAELVLKPV